jgi:flagellar motor protein MotB
MLSIHPTDWHLAAHQAIAVEQCLEENRVAAARLGIVSYASNQPLVQGASAEARRVNARIEIFLLPPDPSSEKPAR